MGFAKTLVACTLLASSEVSGLRVPTPVSRRDALVNAGAGFAAAFGATSAANAVPTIFTVLPKSKSFAPAKPNGVAAGCTTEKPCAKVRCCRAAYTNSFSPSHGLSPLRSAGCDALRAVCWHGCEAAR